MITSPTGFYNSIQEATAHVIDVLSGILYVNTIFIAANDGITNVIVDSFNREEVLVKEGDVLLLSLAIVVWCWTILPITSRFQKQLFTRTHVI